MVFIRKPIIVFTFIYVVFSFPFLCQGNAKSNPKIDSLTNLLKPGVINESQIDLLIKIVKEYLQIDYEKAEQLARETLEKCEKINYKYGKAISLYNIAYAVYYTTDINTSLDYYFKALEIFEQTEHYGFTIVVLSDIAYIYRELGNLEQRLHYYRKAEDLALKVNNETKLGSIYNNLGITFSDIGDNKKAIEYLEKAITIYKKLNNDENLTMPYLNLGLKYLDKGNSIKALECYELGHKYAFKFNNLHGKIIASLRLGDYYYSKEIYEKSRTYYRQGMEIAKSSNHKDGYTSNLKGLAKIDFKQEKYKSSLKKLNEAIEILKAQNNVSSLNDAIYLLSKVYGKSKDFENAYKHQSEYIKVFDSIYSADLVKKIQELEAVYQFEKKELEINNLTILAENKDLEIEKQNAKIQAKKNQQYGLFGGLLLAFIFAGFMYNRFRVTNKQKKIIETQKLEVESKKQIIEKAHNELTVKNKEITDSINYAKRIQTAILPPNKLVKECLNESFILYNPKDIVAGDFYWLEQKEDKILFAAADCTGHGVPGAMVSVVCNNGLNRSVREYGIIAPGKVLDKTREIVTQEFEKSTDDVKDGMDISLCLLDKEKKQLKWAGANNPLWIIRNNEIIEIKPDKQAIGKTENPKLFTTHTINLQEKDAIYIFTDGYQDQFGGEKGKKYMIKNLKNLFLSIANLSMTEQKQKLEEEFIRWKGDLEQVDDVCIIGVRI